MVITVSDFDTVEEMAIEVAIIDGVFGAVFVGYAHYIIVVVPLYDLLKIVFYYPIHLPLYKVLKIVLDILHKLRSHFIMIVYQHFKRFLFDGITYTNLGCFVNILRP